MPRAKKQRDLLDDGEIIRADDVARKLGISRRKVYRLLNAGKLPGFKIGGSWMVARSSLVKFLEKLVAQSERRLRL
jgi:excisionase family DNA binding protein